MAITRLRQVLGDSADAPRYIERVGRKGYRFIAPVESRSPSHDSASAPLPFPARPRRLWIYAGIAFALAVVLAAAALFRRPVPAAQPLVRLTAEFEPELTEGGLGGRLAAGHLPGWLALGGIRNQSRRQTSACHAPAG